MGESGGAGGEAAEGTGTGTGHHSARGGVEAARLRDDRDTAEEGGGGSDGGRGVDAHLGDDGRDVGRDGEDGRTRGILFPLLSGLNLSIK